MAEWWEEFFDEDYLAVYKDRDTQTADREVAFVRKTLRLRRGQRVLDICCGYGRHAVRLAKSGLQVTGLDRNALFLKRARRTAKREGVKVAWVKEDVRVMDLDPSFDAAINLFTSIGYFDNEEDNYQIVARGVAALKPGGWFLLDTINRDRIIRNPQGSMWLPMGRGVVLESPAYDWQRGRMNSRRILVYPNGKRRETRISLRLYTVAEVAMMFNRAGLTVTRVFGGFDGSEYGADSPRIVMIGQKPKRQSSRLPRSNRVAR
jgi:SAM-dependent methyltransferase